MSSLIAQHYATTAHSRAGWSLRLCRLPMRSPSAGPCPSELEFHPPPHPGTVDRTTTCSGGCTQEHQSTRPCSATMPPVPPSIAWSTSCQSTKPRWSNWLTETEAQASLAERIERSRAAWPERPCGRASKGPPVPVPTYGRFLTSALFQSVAIMAITTLTTPKPLSLLLP